MKVLVLTTSFPRWQGDATAPFAYQLCSRLITKGYEIVVLAPHHKPAKLSEEMEGIKVYRFPYFWPKKYQRLCYGGGILPNLRKSPLLWVQAPLLFLAQLIYAIKLIGRKRLPYSIPTGLSLLA